MNKKALAELSAQDLADYGVASGILRMLKEDTFALCGHLMIDGLCRCKTVDSCRRTPLDKQEKMIKNFTDEFRSRKDLFTRNEISKK